MYPPKHAEPKKPSSGKANQKDEKNTQPSDGRLMKAMKAQAARKSQTMSTKKEGFGDKNYGSKPSSTGKGRGM